MATKTKAPAKKATKAPAKAKTAKETFPCLCGCGTRVTRNFAQGHDARLKGMLLRGEVKNPSKEQLAFAKHHGIKVGANKPKAKAA